MQIKHHMYVSQIINPVLNLFTTDGSLIFFVCLMQCSPQYTYLSTKVQIAIPFDLLTVGGVLKLLPN